MKYALINAMLLDGSENMKAHRAAVLVENGRIAAIADDESGFGEVKKIDLEGRYLMPGLINMHVHLPGSGMPNYTKKQNAKSVNFLMSNIITRSVVYSLCYKFARTALMSGVTTIRTVGGLRNIDSSIRDDINSGKRLGPRILAANEAVSVPGGHMAGVLAYEAETEDDCVRYVDLIAQDKPDLIKIMVTGGVLDAKVKGEPGELKMPPELIRACCDEAHRLGFKVAAHVESPVGMTAALENGVDFIEHGAEMSDEHLKLYKEHGAAQICTLSPAVPCAEFPMEIAHTTELSRYNGRVVRDGIINCAKRALENGIPVGLGTDTACPFVTHYDMWRELVYFTKYVGVSNTFALHTATLVNARIAGIDDETGSIEIGKSADLLVTDSDPTADLRALRTAYMVVMRGRVINKPKLKKFDYVEQELDKHL